MENPQALRKWLALRGIAIMTLSDGKKIGSCEDFYFEPQTHNIHALRVKTGFLGHKIVPVASINAVGQHAITIPNEDVLLDKLDDEHMATLLSGEGLMNFRVMSEGGTLVGTIGNIRLDTSTPNALRVVAFELTGSILQQVIGRYPTFLASRVLNYGEHVVVIPDEVAHSLR
jgi:uncharacterized protein YrrD